MSTDPVKKDFPALGEARPGPGRTSSHGSMKEIRVKEVEAFHDLTLENVTVDYESPALFGQHGHVEGSEVT